MLCVCVFSVGLFMHVALGLHIDSVLESCNKVYQQQEDEQRIKIMEKMEQTLKNREEQLNSLKERLQEHVSPCVDLCAAAPSGTVKWVC